MSKVVVMDHPLIQHKIGVIRRKETGSRDFRAMIGEIASLITYEATKDLKLQDVEIETPICKTTVKELAGKKMAIVPILRAGLGMVDGMLAMIPSAKVGHIGLYRNEETLEPVEYYCKLPADCSERDVLAGGHRVFGHRNVPLPRGGYVNKVYVSAVAELFVLFVAPAIRRGVGKIFFFEVFFDALDLFGGYVAKRGGSRPVEEMEARNAGPPARAAPYHPDSQVADFRGGKAAHVEFGGAAF